MNGPALFDLIRAGHGEGTPANPRPLRILGVEVLGLPTGLAASDRPARAFKQRRSLKPFGAE
jgi:hypothetical protein